MRAFGHETGSNRSLSEQIADALKDAAEHKTAAFTAERLYKRKRAEVYLRSEGKTIAEREALATTHPVVTEEEDRWIEAQSKWNRSQARVDGLQVRFEEWRTREATNRAEMNLW